MDLFDYFREKEEHILRSLKSSQTRSVKTAIINKSLTGLKNFKITQIASSNLDNQTKLEQIMLIQYVYYIIMLEARNTVWEYDYMSFSRRIGELWEPFCKLPFRFPVKEDIELYTPPKFDDIKEQIQKSDSEYILNLNISKDEKRELLERYKNIWGLMDSSHIKLDLDLHFNVGQTMYNVDYKSGFSSNEKGNMNRLLLVGSIYQNLDKNYKNLLFVRQAEADNNHYLVTLKNSDVWHVYCADETYEQIKQFTGFDIGVFIREIVDFAKDISPEFKEHLLKNDLLKYLNW